VLATQSKLYLENLKLGDRFVSEEHPLDARQIISFAEQFDPQLFHLDEEQARHSFFQGLAASGWHTAAITMRLLVSSLPLAGGVIGAGEKYPGRSPRVRTTSFIPNPRLLKSRRPGPSRIEVSCVWKP
jgi:acyl dehydratase